MGLKSGSSGDPFDDAEDEQEQDVRAEQPSDDQQADDTSSTDTMQRSTTDTDQKPKIPYIYRRENVNEGRSQVPFFLRDDVRDAEDDLIDTVEEMVGEDVPKSDVREAAMIVAQKRPDLVADELREWGYDYDDD